MEHTILTPRQQILFSLFTKQPLVVDFFYLTGGTALAEWYLHHRYSEDLDFFSDQEVDAQSVLSFFKKIQFEAGFASVDFQQSFNRQLFFLHYSDEVIKTEFTYFPFPRIEKGIKQEGLSIDSLLDIAVNKLFTIYQKPRARDFIDLFLILEKTQWHIDDLIMKAKGKFDWHVDSLQLGSQFLQATEVKDYPRMIIPLECTIWQAFFMEEAKKLKTQILK
ncbi:MAG TPA: hypothetical protein DCY48_00495 [Candidatus Magasanikbacteria bacterium]|nr:MAG: hypothetical protein A3I74_02605 [Candidatus Magasanikbacteria bacterium RIFCSPLOWO2_02_FULL_47_16]OGH79606.1 MAG: hypothetical protein A3C10_00795 [Candidatus Magasanikbacteria bacterium RIFCSPHIGHO2_02_FULL_48_18]OGH82021.1 MAG: hypothetical protein A3G08_02305 [Candidatus Magasanikbacteria bacterium RIFCSPLOWO2_12_FULL_47_9b]HAZ28244.1 hypothetical protein [Candidatus Magasanikbacteria bacterium]